MYKLEVKSMNVEIENVEKQSDNPDMEPCCAYYCCDSVSQE